MQDLLTGNSRRKAIAMLKEAIATNTETRCEVESVLPQDGNSIRFACSAQVILKQEIASILFVEVRRL